MADSTAPILLTGGATLLSDYINGQGVQYRVALATGIAAALFGVAEPANRQVVVGVAWLALVASLIIPRADGKPGPAQTFLTAWNKAGTPAKKAK
jgi:hypothetical protein